MNGNKGIWVIIGLLSTAIAGSFWLTLASYATSRSELASAVMDRNERIRDLRLETSSQYLAIGRTLDNVQGGVQDLRERMRVMECAYNLATCITPRQRTTP